MYSEKLPLVSVLMPAYNHSRFVEQAVRSVWEQSYPNIELIVVDDGSSDETYLILQNLKERSPFRFHLETQKNQGICRTLNRCLKNARGEWIALLASDDMYRSDFIQKMVSEATSGFAENSVFHSDALSIDEHGVSGHRLGLVKQLPPLTGESFFQIAYGSAFIISSTIFLSRKLMLETGGFDELLKAEDFDFHLRLARNAHFYYIDEPIFYSRKVSGSLGSRRAYWCDDLFKALEKHKDFMGDKYSKVIIHRHKKLALAFAGSLDIREALRHYRCVVTDNRSPLSLIAKTSLLLGMVVKMPRALSVKYLPYSAIAFIRSIKHRLIIWKKPCR